MLPRKTTMFIGLAAIAATAGATESQFLTDYSLLQPQSSAEGADMIYVAPGVDEAMANYSSIMVDQPEVHFSAESEYRGLKPEDVDAIASILRSNMIDKLTEGGYAVVEEPGPNVLYMKTAVTELYLKKKKRGLFAYTPVGAVVKAGTDALSETLEKVDIIEMNLEAELADSQTGNIMAAAQLQRGTERPDDARNERMDIDELRETVQEYSARFRCRMDNSRVPESARIDCYDVAARTAREQAGQ